ncbi:tail fiber protein [Bradyrhizobium canariense]|nr:tail fiber protein [Bradyrhizobium canariense]
MAAQNVPKVIVLGREVTIPVQRYREAPKREVSLFGWLVCNVAEIERERYPELFDAIGTKFGGGGMATFMLPLHPLEMRGDRPVRGVAICPISQLGDPGDVRSFDIDRTFDCSVKPSGPGNAKRSAGQASASPAANEFIPALIGAETENAASNSQPTEERESSEVVGVERFERHPKISKKAEDDDDDPPPHQDLRTDRCVALRRHGGPTCAALCARPSRA